MNAPPPVAPAGDMSNGELGRGLVRVEKALGVLTNELREQRAEYVHRTEWDLHQADADRRMTHLEAHMALKADADDLAELKADLARKSPQWTAVAATVVAVISLGWTLLQTIPH